MPVPFALQALAALFLGGGVGAVAEKGKQRRQQQESEDLVNRSLALTAVSEALKGNVEGVEALMPHRGVQKFLGENAKIVADIARRVREGEPGELDRAIAALTGRQPGVAGAQPRGFGQPVPATRGQPLALPPGPLGVPGAAPALEEVAPPSAPAVREEEIAPVPARPLPITERGRRIAPPEPTVAAPLVPQAVPAGHVSLTSRAGTEVLPVQQGTSRLEQLRALRRPGETITAKVAGLNIVIADPSAEDHRATIKTLQVGNENINYQVMGIDQTGAVVLRELSRGPRGENAQAQTQIAKLWAELDAAVRSPEGDPRRSLIPVYEAAIAEQATSTQSIIETRPDGTVSITRGDPRQVATVASRTRFESTIASVQGVKGTISRLRQVTSPQTLGATGYLSGFVHGTLAQVDAFTGLLRNWTQGVQSELDSISDRSNPINISKWFLDPNLPRSQLLVNLLAYELAKAVDTDGRISDKDFELQRKEVLRAGPLSSYQAVLNALDEVERFVNRKEQVAREGLSKIPAGVQPFRHPLSPQQTPAAPTAPPTQQRTVQERYEEKIRAGKTHDDAVTELAQEGF